MSLLISSRCLGYVLILTISCYYFLFYLFVIGDYDDRLLIDDRVVVEKL